MLGWGFCGKAYQQVSLLIDELGQIWYASTFLGF